MVDLGADLRLSAPSTPFFCERRAQNFVLRPQTVIGPPPCFLQEPEPRCPTVVPVKDFDPTHDAARIDAAIKTKGEEGRENRHT